MPLQPTDYHRVISPELLATLTAGQPQLLQAAEAAALAQIESQLAGRYETAYLHQPTSPEAQDALFRLHWADMALYHLYSRLDGQRLPPLRKDRYAQALTWLQQAATGAIRLPWRLAHTTTPTGEPTQAGRIRHGSNPKHPTH